LTPAFPHAEKTPADDDTNWGAASCLDLGSFSGDRIVKIPYAAGVKRAAETANNKPQ
ncbi:MAG: hypothetical protein HYZ65_02975, partial [Burkholderiales bacterium]|nr:hypothetical protein [Burkholderiales bacterium]